MTSGKQFSIWAACMVTSLGAAFAAAGASQSATQVQCEIMTKSSGGMTVIEGVVHAPQSVSGSYSMKVSGNGANISQAGDFEAAAGRTAVLGSVMLSGTGQRVSLDVTAGGRKLSCSQRI